MSKKLKPLGLAFVAALALGAFSASAASAVVQLESTNGKYPSAVTGTGENIGEHFLTEIATGHNIEVKCNVSHYTGTLSEASSVLEVTPTYTECASAGVEAHITHNECKYKFTGTEHESATSTFRAHVGIVCPSGKAITINAGTCEVSVDPTGNGNLTTVDIRNGNGDIKVQPTVKGITYNVTKDGFLCPYTGTGLRHDGEYTTTGEITVTGSNGLQAVTTAT